jgi:hypothetical protein
MATIQLPDTIEDSKFSTREDTRKEWKYEHAKENFEVLTDYRTYAATWRANALRLENARFGRQFSRAEETEIIKFRQAPLPISTSTAIADTADALTISAKPSLYVAPIIHPYNDDETKLSRNVADLYRHLIMKSWFDSLGNLQFHKAVSDRTNVGHGLLYAIPRNEYGEFWVDIKRLSWRYFFGDPSSLDCMYQDMDNQVYAMPISKKAGFKFVKSIEPDITFKDFEDFCKGGITDRGSFEEDPVFGRNLKPGESVLFNARYSLEDETAWAIIPQTDKINTGENEIKVSYTNKLDDRLKGLERAGIIKLKQLRRLYLTEKTAIGNYGYKVVYPISRYCIIPIQYDHRDNPYPYSLMWYLYPLQRALNKFIMSSILNMSLMNTLRVMAEEGSIINGKDWVTSASQPGVILKYKLPIPGYSQKPDVIEPKPFNETWLVMPRFLVSMMEYVTGIYSTLQGNPQGAPDVFSTVASLQSAGGQKIRRRLNDVDASLSVLGEVCGEFYKEYAPFNGFSTHYDPVKQKEELIKYNVLEMKTTPSEKEGGEPTTNLVVKPETNLRRGFRKVRFTTISSSGYEAATEAAMLTTLATQLKVPGLVPAILERIGIQGMDKILDNVDNVKQLEGQNEELQQAVKKLNSINDQRSSQIFQLVKTLEGAKAKGAFDAEFERFKANPMAYMEQSFTQQGQR